MKVSIVGIGKVGATVGFQIATQGIASELVLISRNREKTLGEVLDLRHAAALTSGQMKIRDGGSEESAGSDVIVLTASHPLPMTKQGPDRLSLTNQNTELFLEIVPGLAKLSPNAIFLVVSNPVDILTYVTLRCSGVPAERVIGTGTLIDSARFRAYLSEHLSIHPDDIRAYILGEHGDTQFPVLSVSRAGGWSIANEPIVGKLFEKTVRSGAQVVKAKGYTNFAASCSTILILQAIRENSQRTMPASTLVNDFYGINDVCLSLPVVIGSTGIQRVLPLELNDDEQAKLRASATSLKNFLDPLRKRFSL